MRVWFSALLCFACLLCATPGRAEGCLAPETAPPAAIDGERLDGAALVAFYAATDGACVWSGRDAGALLQALDDLPSHAIDPAPFHRSALRNRLAASDAAGRIERDLLATDAALLYARDMTRGVLEPGDVDADWEFPRPDFDAAAELRDALSGQRLVAWLASLPPADPAYRGLMQALARYREIAASGGWERLPPGPVLHPNQADPRLNSLRTRLRAEGDLARDVRSDGPRFDAAAVAGLKRFQARHGITSDGVLGEATFEALNVPAEIRVAQIAANLERWRWMARVMPDTRIEVNVAAANLKLLVGGEIGMQMRTVVGDAKHRSPILVAQANSFLLNPPWRVPPSIIKAEIMPKLRREPDYLDQNDMRWIGNHLVQAPGPRNSLGRIKLEVRDEFDVYLHDTPAHSYFAKDQRWLSHGCVRMERPLDLAAELLASKPGWAREDIEAAIATGATHRVALPQSITVVLSYWTAEPTPDGAVQFHDDIYGRDARLVKHLGPGWMDAPAPALGAAPRETADIAG